MRRSALALALALLLAGCGGGDGGNSAATTSTFPRVPGAPPFFLPTHLPTGMGVKDGVVIRQGPGHDAYAAAVGRPGAAGAFDDVILVLVGEAAADRKLTAEQAAAITTVDVNGTQARLFDSSVAGTGVDWFRDGLAVGVSGPSGLADRVVDVARRIRLPVAGDSNAATLASAPDGYAVIAQAHFVDYNPEAGQGVSFGAEGGGAVSMLVTKVGGLPLAIAAAGGGSVRPAKVRDHDALVSTRTDRLPNGSSRTTTTFAWRETTDVVISLSAATDAAVLQAIADSMAPVSEEQWRSAVPEPKTPTQS